MHVARLGLVFAIMVAFVSTAFGQDVPECGTDDSQSSKMMAACTGTPDFPGTGTPISDTLRALVIFTKFADDNYSTANRNWPVTLTAPPSFSDSLLSASTSPAQFPQRSLTRMLYEQSQGNLLLYGDVYGSVVTTPQNESYYTNNGWGYLTQDVVNAVVNSVDFTDYDENNDGFVDYIFIMIRRDSGSIPWAGVGDLRAYSPRRGDPGVCLQPDGKKIHWRLGGSIIINHTIGNVDPNAYYVRLMAHEFGHTLYKNTSPLSGGHLVGNTSNGVPANETVNPRVGYALMYGANNPQPIDVGGSQLLSAYERKLAGWISCASLSDDEADIEVGDQFVYDDCFEIQLDANRSIFIDNWQRVDFFNNVLSASVDGGDTYVLGRLTTPGLAITYRDGNTFDFLPADNDLYKWEEPVPAPDPDEANSTFVGDMWVPTSQTQLTPWTRPNINGYSGYPGPATVAWHAIDDIRYSGGGDGEMAFDFIEDFRTAPVITEDSWIGSESESSTFSVDIVVEAGATLTIEEGTDLSLAANLTVKSGATLVIEEGVTISLAPSKQLKVYGELVADGTSTQPITLTSDSNWGGLYFASGSEGFMDRVVVDGVQGWGGSAVYMTNADVSINYSTIRNCAGACIGVQATNNSDLWIYHSTIEDNTSHGVYISGSTAYLIKNNIVDNESASGNQAGVYVTYYANPLFGYASYPYYEGRNTITGSEYGVYATNHGSPDVGTGSSLAYDNRLFGNSLYDAYASSNSDILAKYVWWGENQVDSLSPNCQPTMLYGAVTWYPCSYGSDPGQAFKSGEETVPIVSEDARIRDLLVSAIEHRHLGEIDSAMRDLREILSKAPDAPEVERAVTELGYLYAETQDAGILSLLEAQTAAEKAFATTAREVLMLAHFRVGNDGIGSAIAEELIRDYPDTDHERNALLALFYADMSRENTEEARQALSSLTSRFSADPDVQAALWLAQVEGVEIGPGKAPHDEETENAEKAISVGVQVYPNPFNPVATIAFVLGSQAQVRLAVYDVLGREVARLVNGIRQEGRHEVVFDGTNLPTGVYVYRLEAGGADKSGSVVLAK